jgi:hypothetical protein
MRIRLGPASVDDFKAMDVDWSGHMDHGIENYWELVLQIAATVGLFIDDKCVFILGGIPDGTGILTVFVIASKLAQESREIKRLVMKHWKRGVHWLTLVHPSHFMQAVVNANNPTHVSFMRHFGFQGGYLLPGYTAAGDDVLYFYRHVGGAGNGLAS